MQRRSSALLSLIFALAASQVIGCAQGTTTVNGSGGGIVGSGGTAGVSTGSGGKGGIATGSGGKGGTAGIATGSGGKGGTAGIATGSGGTGGTAGIATGSGGTAGIVTGSGGIVTGSGGNTSCPALAADVICNFEDGTTNLVKQNGMSGWWFVFSDTLSGTLTPAANASGPVAAAQLPAAEQTTCNKWAHHSTATNHTQWVGTGATGSPIVGTENKNKVDVRPYTGISFRIKSASATPIWFEIQSSENQPTPNGTATVDAIDKYNTRGKLLNKLAANTWTTVNVPWGLLGPRWMPADCAASSGGPLCEAPQFSPTNFLGFQFSVYPDFTTAGSYDIWVDDVKFLSGNDGLATMTQTGNSIPFPQNASYGSNCTKPTGADGKFLVDAYLEWKATFVTSDGAGGGSNLRVKRPEDNNDSVSEGIAYGMLIAANFGDKTVFDGLWSYWKKYPAAGSGNTALMHWKIDSSGGVIGSGSATDADEDAAFALLVAGKQWGATYTDAGKAMVGQVWTSDIKDNWVRGGSNFGGSDITNPSYFAPAFYRVFATVDSGHAWSSVITNVYSALNSISGSNGLVPAWCQSNCTTRGGGGYTDAEKYQYDSHRTPWRIGLDYCWNGSTASAAKTYIDKTSQFFNTASAKGIGNVFDIYDGSGTKASNAKVNSMSILGTAAVGAMANTSYASFRDRAFNFNRDALYAPPSIKNTGNPRPWYTYYNATVGLLTAMTMTGNFAKP